MLEIIFVSFLKRNWSQISKFPRCCISAFLRAPRNNGMLIGQRERESREAERERGRRAASERAGKWESQAPGPRGFQHGFSGISHPQGPLILTLVAVQQLGWVGSNKFRVILRSKHGYFLCTLWFCDYALKRYLPLIWDSQFHKVWRGPEMDFPDLNLESDH